MKFLRTIRFDESDPHVFNVAASPDEWAISGAFAFASLRPEDITGKIKQEFANGFLGLESFGRSTFATVSEVDDEAVRVIEKNIVEHFIKEYGAPDFESAKPAAEEEVSFIRELCQDALINTVFTVRRMFDENGEIREEFRTIQAPSDGPIHTKVWAVVNDED